MWNFLSWTVHDVTNFNLSATNSTQASCRKQGHDAEGECEGEYFIDSIWRRWIE